jgi:hypothetical protein
MALPANIRVNTAVPFPAQVSAGSAIAITKTNGIYTVALDFTKAAIQTPSPGNYPGDYILIYDSAAQSYFRVSLSDLVGLTPSQLRVTASPKAVGGSDRILNCSVAGALTVNLPAAASRLGLPLTIKDVSGAAGANNITIAPNGAETIDGGANYIIGVNYGAVTLYPFNDGVGSGWFIL